MKKKFIIIGAIVVVIAAIVAVLLLTNKKVTISFDTDGGKSVSAIKIKKGESITLPEVEKEGFNLDGWYLGEERVTTSTTFDKNVTLKAKWISKDAETFTITFDSDGGSKVDSIKVECGKELILPTNPTKSGYTFVSWVDKNNTTIVSKALLACQDITLKATWKKEETKKEETKKQETTTETSKQKTYKCPSGYNLDGTKCISETEKVEATKSCEAGYSYSPKRGLCYSNEHGEITKVCKKEKVGTFNQEGTLITNGSSTYCGYLEITKYAKEPTQCIANGGKYSYINNKCYSAYIKDNYEEKCGSGYLYCGAYSLDDSQLYPLCVKTKATIRTCSSGYSQDGNYCYKTIDATYE